MPVLAPAVSATSSGLPPMSLAIEARTLLGRSKYAVSGMWWGNFFHSMADWIARMADFGTGLWPARLREVAPSNSCHSCRQSMPPVVGDAGVAAVAMDAPRESCHMLWCGDSNFRIGDD